MIITVPISIYEVSTNSMLHCVGVVYEAGNRHRQQAKLSTAAMRVISTAAVLLSACRSVIAPASQAASKLGA